MNWTEALFNTTGGLAIFLFGMNTLSGGLKASAGDKIRKILSHLTRNRVIALIVGCVVTMAIQSSSATTVMTVGFVNAGLLTFKQAVSLILGANIGTTFTAWIVSVVGKLNIAAYALPTIALGFMLWKFMKNRRARQIGEILFGFGLLFLGLDIMKDAFGPMGKSKVVIDAFAHFSTNPVLGVLVGAFFTMVLQSSSATIAIVQTLAFSGVIGFDAALPLILGDNIGTTITAQLAAIGTNLNARRTAMAHTLFNVLGTIIILPLIWMGLYGRLVDFLLPGTIDTGTVMMHIAFAHSLFNVINALIFTAILGLLVKAASALTFGKEKEAGWAPMYLKEGLLSDPMAAMQQVTNELIRMGELARETVQLTQRGFFDRNEEVLKKASEYETALDEFQRAITAYLIRISEQHLDTRESMEYPVMLHSVNDLEKIGDYCKNIVTYAERSMERKLYFQQDGVDEVSIMFEKLDKLFDMVLESLKKHDGQRAAEAILVEDQIDRLKADVRTNHIRRLNENRGTPEAELMIMDVASNIEKMGDHLISIAKAVRKDLQWGNRPRFEVPSLVESPEVDEEEREMETKPF